MVWTNPFLLAVLHMKHCITQKSWESAKFRASKHKLSGAFSERTALKMRFQAQ